MDAEGWMYFIFFGLFFSIPLTIVMLRYCKARSFIIEGINSKDINRKRARLNAYLFHHTHIGLGLDIFQVVLSLFSCGCYVYETYDDMSAKYWWQILELSVGTLFGADYILRFYLAKDKLIYFFEPMPLIDFVTVVPTFIFAIMLITDEGNISFLRVLRLLRALRVLRVLKIMRLFTGVRAGHSPTVSHYFC